MPLLMPVWSSLCLPTCLNKSISCQPNLQPIRSVYDHCNHFNAKSIEYLCLHVVMLPAVFVLLSCLIQMLCICNSSDFADFFLSYFLPTLQFVESIQLNKKPFHLVGTSMGGCVAGVYAARHPSDLSSLTLICPAGQYCICVLHGADLKY